MPNPKKATARPYVIQGATYCPQKHYEYDACGKASFYGDGDGFHGKKTSTGELYNAHDMTAAHKTLPLPCVVEVINLSNGRRVKLKVNDRGPFVKGRIIDVSTAAAKQLGFHKQGLAQVRVRTLVAETKRVNEDRAYWRHTAPHIPPCTSAPPMTSATPRQQAAVLPKPCYMAYGYDKAATRAGGKLAICAPRVSGPAHHIAIGAFKESRSAVACRQNLLKKQPGITAHIQEHPVKRVKIVRVGPFKTVAEAQRQLEKIRKYGYKDCYIEK